MLRFEMSIEANIAEGKRLVEASGVSSKANEASTTSVDGAAGDGFVRMSGVDPLDASGKDVVACLDAEEMEETQIE